MIFDITSLSLINILRMTSRHILLLALLYFYSVVAFGQTYIAERLNDKINTAEFDEISPVVSADGKTLFFTRVGSSDFNKTIQIDGKDVSPDFNRRDYLHHLGKIYSDIAGRPISDPVRSDFNQDIWTATSRDAEFDKMDHPGYPLNSALPNSLCSLTPDPNEFVVVNQFPKEGGMNKGFSIVRRQDGVWLEPKPMEIDDYEIVSKGISLTMSADGKVIVLSLPGKDSYGDNDLYICFKLGENHWSAPKNMGKVVNSAYREVTPHLSPDGLTLYFASNRPPTYGGLDMFFCSRADDTWLNWGAPRHFVAPINSPADDSQPYFNPATGVLYFSSKRAGNSDIYRVKIAPAIASTGGNFIKGKIINSQTREQIDARVLYGDAQQDAFEKYAIADNGNFLIKSPSGRPVKMLALQPGYINHEVILTQNDFHNNPQEVTLLLDPLSAGANISMQPVYFERSKAIILKDSYAALDNLVDILKQHKELHILIEGHTDNQGESASLQKLSEERAEVVRRYLVYQKVKPERLQVTGYGATRPITSLDTDSARSLNRRVEVKISKALLR